MTSPTDNDLFEDDEEVQVPVAEQKGNYRLVRLADEESCETPRNDAAAAPNKWLQVLQRPLISDQAFSIRGIRILDGPEAVKFLKFVALTLTGLVLVHYFVMLMNWERDTDYKIADMLLYDLNYIMLDITVYYFVGRLFRQNGVDHLAWILTSFLGAIYVSWTTTFAFLRYSLSLYEMHCAWPWKLWLFVGILIPLLLVDIIKHVQYAVDRNMLVVKLVELSLTILFFLVPVASDPNFHFHHWYAGWMVGMHANFDTWWSRATMAWCWGLYMQGVGVYGRDPVLTCAYSYYLSTDERCPYMSCYLKPSEDNTTHPDYQPMERPDWRNCSGYIP